MNRETQTDPTHVKLARAIQALQQTRLKLEATEAAQHEPIAIIGMGCHYPGGADSAERFWQNLLAGVDSITELPAHRVKDMFGEPIDALSTRLPTAATTAAAYAFRGGFLDRVDEFEPAFFGLSPREVLVMDPAHRLLLETAWQALEDANLVPLKLFNTEMGVFIGNAASGYTQFCAEQEDDLYKATGNVASTAAGRLSYLFGITGPCVSLDTACSSSLVAIHLACQSLRTGECTAALAGGVNVILEAGSSAMFANGNMLSGEARCKTFDAAADGYVRGEGCGMLVLKRLSDAQAHGDRILAVIRGTAVNQDGPSGGLTVPNGPAQERVIRRALADGKLKPEQISYIEAHGTGTPLGDPIEIGALSAVFGERQQPLYVGSVKTNIGHLEMAAGVAGVMKLVLAIQHGQLPPHLHFQTPNPHIDWAATPVQVPTAPLPWPASATNGERIGGVSSFGFSGTNAHIIISQAPQADKKTEDKKTEDKKTEDKKTEDKKTEDRGMVQARSAHLLTISAKSQAALQAYAHSYSNFLQAQPAVDLGDLCYTSHTGRSHFAHRLSITATSVAELQQRLAAAHPLIGATDPQSQRQGISYHIAPSGQLAANVKPAPTAFLFTGQGAQYAGMGRELYATNPTFRAALDRCEALYREYTGESLLAVLYPEQTPEDRKQSTEDSARVPGLDEQSKIQNPKSKIDDTTYTQPALFALEVALATLWQSWGVQPAILIGHSVGEVAAACVAGVFSLEDGMKLITARGRLMGALPQNGAMIAVTATETEVQRAIAAYAAETELVEVAIAAVNGPTSIVISGQRDAVTAVAATLTKETGADTGGAIPNRAQGAPAKIKNLNVSHAFHSPLMEPMLDAFRRVAESITYHPPTVPLISNITGQLASADITTPDYWVRHVRDAVRFADGITTLHEQGVTTFLEIGPKPVLLGMAQTNYELRMTNDELRTQGSPANYAADKRDSAHAMRNPPLLLPSLRETQPDWQPLFTSLGALYTQGVEIDWEGVERGYQRRKIGLPTYCFQRQRYWPTARQSSSDATDDGFARWLAANPMEQLTDRITTRLTRGGTTEATERSTVAKVLTALEAERVAQQQAAQIESLLYEVVWERQAKSTPRQPFAQPGRWLILADAGGIGGALAAQVTALGETVTLVEPTATPAEAVAQLTAALQVDQQTAGPLRGILYLGALTAPTASLAAATVTDSLALLQQSQEHHLTTLLQLLQTLVNAEKQATSRLWVVTQGAQQLFPTEPVAVAQSALWGMGRVIALEHGELWGGLLDVDPLAEALDSAHQLLAELWQPDAEEQIAYRAGKRYVARLVAARPPMRADAPPIQGTGSYLVTGGLGSLGLQTVQWLVAEGARHVIITGRRGVQTPTQQAILDALHKQGATIQIAQVDVADEQGMTQLFADLATVAQPLRGVIHLAGVAGAQALRTLQWADVAQVLRPKLLGGWLLHRLTAALPLDFFLCYSSGAGIWGGKQQAHYGAANHFLDGLMAYRRAQGLPGLSIAWGPWAGGGMATPEAQALLQRMGVRALPPAQALGIQAHLLQTAAIQITAAAIDWSQFKPLYALDKPRRFLEHLAVTPPTTPADAAIVAKAALVQELQTLSGNQRIDALHRHVQQAVSRILGLATVLDTATGFADLGMDSLMALELRRQLEEDFGQTLPTTLAFEYPTVEKLATYLLPFVQAEAGQPVRGAGATTHLPQRLDEPIAVISMACRFPGADTPEAFWQLLQAGVDMVREVPQERWPVDNFYDSQRPTPGKMYTREGAFLDQVDAFDPLFFGIAPREAVGLDPHHRLLLETGWEALERAGLAQSVLVDSRTGVFVGIGESDFAFAHGGSESQGVTSSGHSAAAGRLAYTLGLQGPTLAVDTACSSSLVALHLACQSLRTGECDLALAGGVNLTLSPFSYIALSQMQALAPDGRCKSFDAAADGYGRGEGGGLVLLKRLSDAERDGDTILALIKGSAVNHDGPSSGLTVPNKSAQEKLIRQALATAHVLPEEVSYIEAHGTGTALGDPIELRALGAVFGAERSTPLLVGSVKTNIGHLEAAAGIAGFIKTVLALQHGLLPPHLHFQTPSPHIAWDALAIEVPTVLQPWPRLATDTPPIAGVSAFGLSGTNAHLVVAQAAQRAENRGQKPDDRQPTTDNRAIGGQERPYHLLTLSAKSGAALPVLAQRYLDQLHSNPQLALGDLCHTAALGRNHFTQRLALVASDLTDLQAQLRKVQQETNTGALLRGAVVSPRPRIAFLFTGQGAQYVEMGRALYETEPTFRAVLDRCEALYQAYTGESLLAVLYPADKTRNTLDDTTYTQPALFALEVALATLWQSWGVGGSLGADYLLGHSVGEVAAACVAGVFSLEDGMKLITARGRLMGALPHNGAMIAVTATEAEVQRAIAAYAAETELVEVAIAAVNGPTSIVISGERDAVNAVAALLLAEADGDAIPNRAQGGPAKIKNLNVSHAFHSPLMEPMLDDFRRVAESITYHTPTTALIANVTGELAGVEITTADYWVRHVREAVRFADGIATLQAQGIDIFLEIGPKPVLVGMAEQMNDWVTRWQGDKVSTSPPHPLTPSPGHPILLPSLRENHPDWQQMLTSLGAMYVTGVKVDWSGFDNPYQRRKVLLPTYPFQRQRYWPEATAPQTNGAEKDEFARWLAAHPLAQLTDRIAERLSSQPETTDTHTTITEVLTALADEQRAQEQQTNLQSLLYAVTWERQRRLPTPAAPPTAGHWLLLDNGDEVGQAMATQLATFGETTTRVQSEADLAAALHQLVAGSGQLPPLRGVLQLWALAKGEQTTAPAALADTIADLMQRQERLLGSVLQVVQALAGNGAGARLWVVTQGAQQVAATEAVAVDQTPLWGMGRVIALEHGELWGGILDLDSTRDAAEQAPSLLAEILQLTSAGEEQIAYRQGERYVARLAPAQLTTTASAPAIHSAGSYLITGGLGSLGLQTAQWLVKAGARHLILTGRRGVPNKKQQALLNTLKAAGAEIQIAPIDVADVNGMVQLFADLAAAAPPLRGLFHEAGVASYKALRSLQWADFESMIRPKVIGGWLLHALTADLDLDFFIAYSSGAGIWGGKQQAHYGAANHFLDGLMAYRHSQGLPGLSIAWGPWAGGGMATPEAQAMLQAMGVRALAPEQGLAIQAYLLQTAASSVTVADIDWAQFKPLYEMSKPRRFLANLAITGRTPGQPDDGTGQAATIITELQALPAGQRVGHLRRYLRTVVGQVLGLGETADEAFTNSTGFTDLGMDSLMALEVRRQLERGLNHPLPTTIALEYPSIAALATYLLDHLQLQTATAALPRIAEGQRAERRVDDHEPIAVLSMACRFPGADTPEAFWQLLHDGLDMVQPVPATRWDVDAFYDPQRPMPGKMYTREAAFIQGVDEFDPLFFGIAPREAVGMDPQHRLILEVGWEALERAGIAPSSLVDSQTGVFVGIGAGDYGAMGGLQSLSELDTHTATSSGHSIAAGRLAYALGLQGPTLSVDTACSSSLVALHLACQSLRNGECDLALAGGVKLMLSPLPHIALAQLQAISPDGRCKTFDAAADGYGRGEGCGVVTLKRLSDAERDGDPILAVIKGGAVNHNGPSSGLTVPNKRAQEKLLRQALAMAGVAPAAVGYIEAHGTGTSLGDPIEIRALGAVFGAQRATPLLVGSVKTNVAHLEEAAGVAGFIKTVLALQHGEIPPHLHFSTPNPYIEWDEVAIAVPTTLQPWPTLTETGERVAGVSSFGLSGTNAHLIVASAPQGDKVTGWQGDKVMPTQERPLHLLTLSAKHAGALPRLAQRYQAHLTAHPAIDLGDLCYTAATGRSHFNQRLAIVAGDSAAFVEKLAALAQGQETDGVVRGAVAQERPQLAFLFTGQGAQYVDMGRQLYETQPLFRAVIERCDAVAHQALGRSLIDLLYPATTPEHNDIVESHPCGQAVNFAVQCALVELWQSWGIQPDLVLGHSLGDFAAAYAAGVLSLEDGLRLVSTRGRLMEQAVGSMVSIMGSETDVAPFVAPYADVVIGVINGPRSVVISGGHTNVQTVTAALEAAGFKTRKVAVPMAAHSPLLDPVLDEFEQFIRTTITLHPPQRPVVSSMTGKLVTDELTDPTYWRNHLRNPVRFVDGVETLAAEGATIFIEIGPKPTLLGMVEPILEGVPGWQGDKVTNNNFSHPVTPSPRHPVTLSSLRQNEDDWQQMLTNLGELYVRGVAIDWASFDQPYARRKLLLPTYPFQRERYWLAPPKQANHGLALRPLIHQVTRVPLHGETIFATEFSVETLPFLADHRVYDTVVSPGACQLAMILSAAELIFDRQAALTVRDLILPQALVLPDKGDSGGARTVQAVFTANRTNGHTDTYDVKLISFTIDEQDEESDLATHTTGEVAALAAAKKETVDLAELRQRCNQAVDVAAFYAASAQAQIELGPSFCWLAELWQGQNDAQAEALAKLILPEAVGVPTGYVLHPGLLDGCFQTANTAGAAIHNTTNGAASGETLLPFAVQMLQLHQPLHGPQQQQWWCHATQVGPHKWDIRLYDEQGALLAVIDGFEMRAAAPQAIRQADAWQDWLYEVAWQPRPYYGLAPDYLPPPATLTAALAAPLAVLMGAERRAAEQRLWRGLEELSIDYIGAAFARAGFTLRVGEQWRLDQIVQQISVIPSYRRLLYRLLMILTDAGLLEYAAAAGVWVVRQTPATVQPAVRLAALQTAVGPTPEVALLARCGEKLSEVLRGLQEPESLLYPSTATAESDTPPLAHAPGAPVIHTLLQELVKQVVAKLPAACGLRIIELGAGPGAVTAGLLPLLPAERTDYLFTDADAAWVSQAATRFAAYPFLRYQLLDLEQLPVDQQSESHQADLVIAVNVLHATANVDQALAQVRRLLNPGGQLVLVEMTQPNRFAELTWGLSPRWWQFQDDRQEQPLLPAAAWETRLLAQGFQSVQWLEQDGCALLIAQTSTSSAAGQVMGAELVEAPADRQWLIFADRQGVGAALAGQLRRQGVAPRLVYAAQHYQHVDENTLQIHPDQAADYQRLLAACPALQGVVHLWSLDTPTEAPTANLVALAQASCGSVLHLVQALPASSPELTGFWLVTQEAQAATAQDRLQGIAQSALWGMGRVIALEHPELNCVRIDLTGADPIENRAARLCAEIMAAVRNAAQRAAGEGSETAPQEQEVALRQEARYLARLTRHVMNQGLPLPDQPYRLEITERGTLDHLQLRPAARRAPAAGEVEIAIQASGLNFRDLLNVLGLYPGDPGPIGAECAGVIVAVGPDVTNFTVGDEVLAMAPNSFSQYVTAATAAVVHKPATLNAAEAAALPSVFVTAYYGLHELARMKAGDRVLIHAAAGGVGMAAVQLAQVVGAEVFATASPSKWAALRAMGVKHLYNSRTIDFAAQLLADTDGQGVAIILNSLTGPGFIEANLAALAPGGYLIEMSKRDAWEAAQIAAVRPDVRYSLIDLIAVGQQQPALLQTMLARIMALYAQKQLMPLPYTAFPIQQAIAAFRYMQQAKHIGKIVLTPPSANNQIIKTEATYLITGGLGGLGLAVAQWLAAQGARHLMLLGRSQPKAELQASLAALTALGVKVTLAQADITVPEQIQAALQQIDAAYPLRGIVHAAGVLDDAALANQQWARFAKVLAPKVQGVWQLHQLTRNMTLDFFVVFSSTAGLLGNRGQANHAAANAFLDAFVHYRRAQGLPALSINWGAWAEIGAAAELVRTQQQQMFAQGMGVITPQHGIDAFAYLLAQAGMQATGQPTPPQVGVAPIHWAKFLQHRLHASPFYREFRQAETATVRPAEPVRPAHLRRQLDETASSEERHRLLQNYLQTTVARVLGLRNPEQIDPREGLLDMGLDSLMAVELRNQIGRTLETRLPSTLVFDYPTVDALCSYLLAELFVDQPEAPPTTVAPPAPDPQAEQVPTAEEAESDDEIAKLLAQLVYSGN